MSKDNRLDDIQKELNEASGLLINAINDEIVNIGKAEEIGKETEKLVKHTKECKDAAKEMRDAMCWKKFKVWFIGFGIALVILLVIGVIVTLLILV